jgi:hypothetical protein
METKTVKNALLASAIAVLTITGGAQAETGVVTATHAGRACYAFQVMGVPGWYGVSMIGTGFAAQAMDIANSRDTGQTLGFSLDPMGTVCQDAAPTGQGNVPEVLSINLPPLPGQ